MFTSPFTNVDEVSRAFCIAFDIDATMTGETLVVIAIIACGLC